MSGHVPAALHGAPTDRGKRASDAVSAAVLAGGRGRWIALRLSDGGSDGALYDRKSDAVRHQLHPTQCAYLHIPAEGATPRQAETYLRFMEGLYRAGADLSDPDRVIHAPVSSEHMRPVVRAVKRMR